MKPLTPLQNIIYIVGGLLLLIGAALPLFLTLTLASAILFFVGSVAFAWGQYLQSYEGKDLSIKRLYHQQLLGCALWILTAIFMVLWVLDLPPFYGEVWKLTLAIGVVFYCYTTFRIASKLKKEI